MKESLQLLDVVALLEDHPEAGLVAGQVGVREDSFHSWSKSSGEEVGTTNGTNLTNESVAIRADLLPEISGQRDSVLDLLGGYWQV